MPFRPKPSVRTRFWLSGFQSSGCRVQGARWFREFRGLGFKGWVWELRVWIPKPCKPQKNLHRECRNSKPQTRSPFLLELCKLASSKMPSMTLMLLRPYYLTAQAEVIRLKALPKGRVWEICGAQKKLREIGAGHSSAAGDTGPPYHTLVLEIR